ncbi:MAG TPA: CE1759 family FMN reductase [Propionibacteriaceae bacterium]
MSARSIMVITAGLGQPSSTRLLGERLGTATEEALRAVDVASTVRVVELREYAHDLTNQLLTGFPSARLAELIEQVIEADALIAVTPIFSASYSGLFKTFFDVLQPESLAGKPVLIAATAGTARHSLALEHALRPLFAYLRTIVVPTAVFAATEDWASEGGLRDRITRAAGELAALLAPRGRERVVEPEVTPFATLLGAANGSGPRSARVSS